jgi:microcystin-dependent protein
MSEPFIAEIRMFGGNFAPRGWAFCNGALLAISQNSALFSILGTVYGGDGVTTFGLPDLRGRVPVGEGQAPGLSNRRLGAKFGSEEVTLTSQQMPAHTHGTAFGLPTDGVVTPTPEIPIAHDGPAPGTSTVQFQSGSTGQSLPVPTSQPSHALTFIIATVGIYPSRS